MQNLAKQWKEPPVIILQQANFYNTYSVVVAKNHQNIRSRFLVHEFSLTDIFLNSILYGCDFSLLLWKGAQNNAQCNCIHTSLSIFILFQLQSWIILTDEVFAQEFSYEESDYGDSDDEDIKQLYIWLVK